MCERRKKIAELLSSVCTSGVYTLKFHFLDRVMNDDRKVQDMSVLGSSGYEQFQVHMKRAYRASSKRVATRMKATVMLIKRQHRSKRYKMHTELRSTSQHLVPRIFFNCIGEGVGLLKSIWNVGLNEILRFVASVGMENERNEKVKHHCTCFQITAMMYWLTGWKRDSNIKALNRLIDAFICLY